MPYLYAILLNTLLKIAVCIFSPFILKFVRKISSSRMISMYGRVVDLVVSVRLSASRCLPPVWSLL